MEHQNAATLPAGTKVRVAYTEGDSERYEHFEGDAVVITPHPRSGALWQVALLEPTLHRSIVTNLSRNGAVIRVLAEPVVTRPLADQEADGEYDPDATAVFANLEGDEIKVRPVFPTETAELLVSGGAYPAGTRVEISCHVYDRNEDGSTDLIDMSEVYLDLPTLRALIDNLTSLAREMGYVELAAANAAERQAELAESTAGDPPPPADLRLGCSGQCGACSRG